MRLKTVRSAFTADKRGADGLVGLYLIISGNSCSTNTFRVLLASAPSDSDRGGGDAERNRLSSAQTCFFSP